MAARRARGDGRPICGTTREARAHAPSDVQFDRSPAGLGPTRRPRCLAKTAASPRSSTRDIRRRPGTSSSPKPSRRARRTLPLSHVRTRIPPRAARHEHTHLHARTGEASGFFAVETRWMSWRLRSQSTPWSYAAATSRPSTRAMAARSPAGRSAPVTAGADRFGWANAIPPRPDAEGRLRIGWGMAAGRTTRYRAARRARARPRGGAAVVETAASDMGPGTTHR